MALESEVLSANIPLVVIYYFKESIESQKLIQKLENLAAKYDNQIKVVTIDADKLFSLAQNADIEKLPTLLFVKDREIINRIEDSITIEQLEHKLSAHGKGFIDKD